MDPEIAMSLMPALVMFGIACSAALMARGYSRGWAGLVVSCATASIVCPVIVLRVPGALLLPMVYLAPPLTVSVFLIEHHVRGGQLLLVGSFGAYILAIVAGLVGSL